MNQDDQTKAAETVPDMAVNQLPEAFLFYQFLFQKKVRTDGIGQFCN